MASAGYGIRED